MLLNLNNNNNNKKDKPRIGCLVTLLSLIFWSIITSSGIIQLAKIACWKNHQSWGLKYFNDQYLVVYILETKWLSMTTKFVCWRVNIWIHSVCYSLTQIFILNSSEKPVLNFIFLRLVLVPFLVGKPLVPLTQTSRFWLSIFLSETITEKTSKMDRSQHMINHRVNEKFVW